MVSGFSEFSVQDQALLNVSKIILLLLVGILASGHLEQRSFLLSSW